ncbi:MAG: LacI family DNA-binding transcriptional regulator [Armatimonadota bacterium]
MSVTIIDIARAAGVGKTTVYRTLNGVGYVSAETKERVMRLVKEMNYRPNHIARSLVSGQSRIVAVATNQTIQINYRPIIEILDPGLRESGYSLMLHSYSDAPGSERLCLEKIMQNRVAGVMTIPGMTPSDPEPYRQLIDSGIKLIVADGHIDVEGAAHVNANEYQATFLATQYLANLGHRNIVYLAVPTNIHRGRERLQGFQDALNNAGIAFDPSFVVETPCTAEAGEEAIGRLLSREHPPTALVARQDVVALGALRAVLARGLSVPGDMSIIGYGDDLLYNDLLKVPLTTVHHPSEELTVSAAQAMLEMLNGEDGHEDIVLDVHLVERDSCAPPKDT